MAVWASGVLQKNESCKNRRIRSGRLVLAFGVIFCHFFLLAMFTEFYSLIPAIDEQIHEGSYYVTLISSSDSFAARLTG